ncbi:MAG: CDP-alcohol phosphatidyltransferase family protein [Alysiella sp.]|uniref:CDP-alcohol phosphatidyltransferase family protein n=1 Tax=Alysiella sp. TaxID=1872483 RepID=UPI0026DA7684|nr:CDP-alcohol phosphatidyltransferase family protein [Alysiella sp.]MDO4434438.1 CDP-alcohol phosphatidyltransferase family protein [Alysiella sp.]
MNNIPVNETNRRPIQARGNPYLVRFAAYLAHRQSPTPNQISCLSAVFALLGALMILGHNPFTMVCAALFIQLRLLCNLMDGMVAVEGGKKTAIGEIFNEFPDRIADSVLLIATGYACGAGWLGWLAALLAALTAYIRVFGGSLGFAQSFIGPMAKQQRMAVLTLACVVATFETAFYNSNTLMFYFLFIITIGTAYTCYTRTRQIATQMQQRHNNHAA